MDGIINIYKEKGFTSHDVVAKLRGFLRQKKIGHTGTLDPDAVGVLPVCLGKATKLCDMITDKSKTYEAVLLLGVTTDTQDITGTVLDSKAVDGTSGEIEQTVLSFVGEYKQIPPMYSALKVNGKKLYELARAGVEIERKARTVTIDSVEIQKIELPRVYIKVDCSKGTYIRTLCHDIGMKLGCGGCMESLVRTKVGIFSIDNALTLSQIEQLNAENRLARHIIPIPDMFEEYKKIVIKETDSNIVYNGNPFTYDSISNLGSQEERFKTMPVRVYDFCGRFIGIYEWNRDRNVFKVKKMFTTF